MCVCVRAMSACIHAWQHIRSRIRVRPNSAHAAKTRSTSPLHLHCPRPLTTYGPPPVRPYWPPGWHHPRRTAVSGKGIWGGCPSRRMAVCRQGLRSGVIRPWGWLDRDHVSQRSLCTDLLGLCTSNVGQEGSKNLFWLCDRNSVKCGKHHNAKNVADSPRSK